MKKIICRLFTLVLAMLIVATSLVACGGGGNPANSSTDIEIYLWKSGVGDQFLKDIIAGFEKKHPEYNVMLEAKSNGDYINTMLPLGPDQNSIDLFFVSKGSDYEKYCATLDDVLASKNEGESKTIGEKIGNDRLQYFVSKDGKYYSLSYYGGFGFLCYNADIIDGVRYDVPKTTNELYTLAMDLYSDGITPFIHFIDGGYWQFLYKVWRAQYFGVENCIDLAVNPTLEKVTDDGIGIKQVFETLEQLISSSGMVYNGSNSIDFTSAQTLFIEGKAAMMANGSWMENEMRENYAEGSKNFATMKTPVISAIRDLCTTIESDAELSALVTAIDENFSDLIGAGYNVSQADYDRVYAARNLMFNNFDAHTICIPKYSTAIDGAKEFLKYFFSDEAMLIYCDAVHSKPQADFSNEVTVDTSSWSKWAKQQDVLYKDVKNYIDTVVNTSIIYSAGGLNLYGEYDRKVIKFLSNNNPADKKTANQMWNAIKALHNEKWTTYLRNAGLEG